VFWRRNGNWNQSNENSVSIRFWDPQKLYDWLGRAATTEQEGAGKYEIRPWSKEQTLEIIYDRRNRPAPDQYYWDDSIFSPNE
jgi:hypothetical protein